MKLRKMNAEDWFGFQGAEHFPDDSEPLIRHIGNEKVVILDATGLNFGISSEKWYRLECTKITGMVLINVMEDNISEKELIEYGFVDIM